MEHTLEIDIHSVQQHDNHQYRLYINDELFIERPYHVPPEYDYQTVMVTCELQKENTIRFEVLEGYLRLGELRLDKTPHNHTNGYFEL